MWLRLHVPMKNETLEKLALLAGRHDVLAWKEAAELIRQAAPYRWVGLYEVTATEIRAVAWTGAVAPTFPRFPRGKGLNGVVVRTGEPVVCQDVTSDPRYLTAFPSTGSEAIFPVFSEGGEVVGTIDVESDRRNAFSAEDERFLRACAANLRTLWQSAPHPKA